MHTCGPWANARWRWALPRPAWNFYLANISGMDSVILVFGPFLFVFQMIFS